MCARFMVILGHEKLVPETETLSLSTTRLHWMRQSDKRLFSSERKLSLCKPPVRLSQLYPTHSATRVCTEMDRYELLDRRYGEHCAQGPVAAGIRTWGIRCINVGIPDMFYIQWLMNDDIFHVSKYSETWFIACSTTCYTKSQKMSNTDVCKCAKGKNKGMMMLMFPIIFLFLYCFKCVKYL